MGSRLRRPGRDPNGNLPGASVLQYMGASLQRRAGGHHVVNQSHVLPADLGSPLCLIQHECVPGIATARIGIQSGLGAGSAAPPEAEAAYRDAGVSAHGARQNISLVEQSAELARSVQGYRDQQVGEFRALLLDGHDELGGEHCSASQVAIELEPADQPIHRELVEEGGVRPIPRWRIRPTRAANSALCERQGQGARGAGVRAAWKVFAAGRTQVGLPASQAAQNAVPRQQGFGQAPAPATQAGPGGRYRPWCLDGHEGDNNR